MSSVLTFGRLIPGVGLLVLCLAAQGYCQSGDLQLTGTADFGIFFSKREPAFYTGFAPRVDNPKAIHIHLGRGNQLRVTLVVSQAMQVNYVRDLWQRWQTYQRYIRAGEIELSQNHGFEYFRRILTDEGVKERLAAENRLSVSEIRERNWRLIRRLNPGRAFEIKLKLTDLARNWLSELAQYRRGSRREEDLLALASAVLPTRFFVTELTPESRQALNRTINAAGSDRASFLRSFQDLFLLLSDGIYPILKGLVSFREFTAIYPIGSWDSFTVVNGRKIPAYPTPGRRALTTHQRTKTVDHIPTKTAYSYFPWIPYMHVGTRLHNSFHTLWWPARLEYFSFLSPVWLQAAGSGQQRASSLFLLSRGPMSNGCTHLNGGHILELRQMLPADEADLYRVDTFLNRSTDYDVFDIDGDLRPEVMGVAYFIAYSLKDKHPYQLRVANRRREFYDWLYGGDLKYDSRGQGYFENPQAGAFVGRQARPGRSYGRLPLYEAAYQPEQLQFFKSRPIPFVRELRKVAYQQ